MTGHRLRKRSVDNVLEEITTVLADFPEARSIFFEDDTLTADLDRCLALCDGIRTRGLRFTWTANARADLPGAVMQELPLGLSTMRAPVSLGSKSGWASKSALSPSATSATLQADSTRTAGCGGVSPAGRGVSGDM